MVKRFLTILVLLLFACVSCKNSSNGELLSRLKQENNAFASDTAVHSLESKVLHREMDVKDSILKVNIDPSKKRLFNKDSLARREIRNKRDSIYILHSEYCEIKDSIRTQLQKNIWVLNSIEGDGLNDEEILEKWRAQKIYTEQKIERLSHTYDKIILLKASTHALYFDLLRKYGREHTKEKKLK